MLDRLNALDPIPDVPAERQALIDGARQFGDGCQANASDLLPFMRTEDAARDMDRIRAALGDSKLTYLGFSYGTFLGATYAGLFPTKVRALVLDGALDPTLSFVDRTTTQAVGFSEAFTRFLEDCAARASCPFHNGGDPQGAYDALMAQIDAQPLPATATGDSRPVGPGEAFTGVVAAMYDQSTWSVLAQGLKLAQNGDGSILLLLADSYNRRAADGTYENIASANNAVNCADYIAPTEVAAYVALAPKLEKLAPRFGEAVAYGSMTCAFWPFHPSQDPGLITAKGAPPILVVGSTGDPATPYEWAVKLAKQLDSGVLLTRRGEGHTAYGGKSGCIDAAVDTYLITLKPPADGTVCG
jgi:pimeloyl-ACP methyl ester carboxylesterase